MKKLLLILIMLIFSIGISSASSIEWYDYETGIGIAEKSGKPMIIFGYGETDPFSIKYETDIFSDPEIIQQLDEFVCVKANAIFYKDHYFVPWIIFTNKNGQEVLKITGYVSKEQFSSKISEAISKKDDTGEPFQYVPEEYEKHDLGEVTIMEYKSFFENLEQEKIVEVDAKINKVTIRDLSGPSYNSLYTLTLDDGTDTMRATYIGGLGDINTGDKVDVNIEFSRPMGYKIIDISKSGIVGSQYKTTSNDDTSSKETPGFSFITGVFVLFFIWNKMRRLEL